MSFEEDTSHLLTLKKDTNYFNPAVIVCIGGEEVVRLPPKKARILKNNLVKILEELEGESDSWPRKENMNGPTSCRLKFWPVPGRMFF